ncbi:MAG TPA: hypothetical protein VH251_09870 [Verrucomicrobiae bacterium]|jgi:hypothetical protein|nr:hypothetical protein [Verrucomicrobiae bacterium]
MLDKKTLVWLGENEFFPGGQAKSLRYGIRPAKKFLHKVLWKRDCFRPEPVYIDNNTPRTQHG